MKHCKTIHHFTLVELIVVIGLIGLFLGIAMPAFTNVSKGRSNSAACTEIAGQISIARSYSIQHHCYTALIFLIRMNSIWGWMARRRKKKRLPWSVNITMRPCGSRS